MAVGLLIAGVAVLSAGWWMGRQLVFPEDIARVEQKMQKRNRQLQDLRLLYLQMLNRGKHNEKAKWR